MTGPATSPGGWGIPPWDGYLDAGQPAMFAHIRAYLAEHPIT